MSDAAYHEVKPSPRPHGPSVANRFEDSATLQESPQSSLESSAVTLAASVFGRRRQVAKGQSLALVQGLNPDAAAGDDAEPRGQQRALPKVYLNRGYQANSYFAKRLRNAMIFISLLDLCGILVFWLGNDIDDGGLYVKDVVNSLAFRKTKCQSVFESCRSCNTVVSYAMVVYHMLPVVVMIGLPASGWRMFEPFKRELRSGGEHDKSKVKRSLFLQACELVSVVVVLVNAVILLYFVYSFFQGDNFNCGKTRVQFYTFGALVCYFSLFVELTYFARFREHLKMQLGAFKEADQTGDIRSRLARRSSQYRSERSRVINDIRKKLFKNTELANLREVENILAYAQNRLGEDFAEDMYKNATIFCKTFGRSKKNPMHIAAYHGNIHAMDLLVRAGFKVNNYDKVSRVRFSTGDLFWYFAQYFISKPALSGDENAVSIFKTTLVTPLHCAVSTGQISAVKWLISHGADVNLHSQSSYWSERVPPLFHADNPEIVTLLLEAGANHLEVPDPGHMNTLTVLQLAYMRGNIPVAQELEQWGGDVALTPLHAAAASNNVAHVRKLLKKGADPNSLGEHGYVGMNRRTPLHWGSINGSYAAVEILLDTGADPNFQDVQGRTPLHWAARVSRVNVLRLLLERDADPHIRDERNMTPILCAAQAANVTKEVFELLVRHGANINDELLNGDTPLHIAMKTENQTSALALLSCGADIMRTNMDGFRPVDCTTSTQLQFEIKRAAGNRDVMISYTHSHSEFAQKLRKSLEHASVTTWLDQMDPSGIGGGSVWREEIARGIQNAALVVCILTEDYAKSEWCLKELALAKESGTPIMAISTERAPITEELQVYLYTRQMVPFEPSITAVDNSNPRSITYTYDETRFAAQFRLLLDGVRDEIEKQRKELIRRGNRRLGSDAMGSSAYDLATVTDLDLSTITTDFVFLSHGDHHRAFAQRIYDRLTESGVYCFFDGSQGLADMQERIHLAKEAILKCSCFIVIVSNRTAASELVRDQLAFAEDKGRPILPIMLNELELSPDKLYTLSRTQLLHFTPELGFNASFASLLAGVQKHVNMTTLNPARATARSVRPSLFSVARATAFGRLKHRADEGSTSNTPAL